MALLSQAPQQYVVAASCPWMGAWLCLMMQPSHIPIDVNMLLEVKARSKVVHFIREYTVWKCLVCQPAGLNASLSFPLARVLRTKIQQSMDPTTLQYMKGSHGAFIV